MQLPKTIYIIYMGMSLSSGGATETQDTIGILEQQDEGVNAIIGGAEIKAHSRPYLVALGKGPDSWMNSTCGGSLISPHAVLTAAHCLFNDDNDWDPRSWVEFNRHNLSEEEPGAVRMYLGEADNVPHPKYVPSAYDYDVAVLFLPIAMTGISPITMNENPSVPTPGDSLDVSGWGDTDPDPEEQYFPQVPHAVTVNYITNQACVKDPYQYESDDITENMLCAFKSDKDSCKADSGGPLVLGKRNGGPLEPFLQVGVVSFGEGCAVSTFPGVYTRMSSVVDWVKTTVCARTGELCHVTSKSGKGGSKTGKAGFK